MNKQKISVLFSKSAVLLLLLLATAIYGQTPTANLSGVVRDEQGEVLKDVTVGVKNTVTVRCVRSTLTRRGDTRSPF
jgi:hypothetical protein